MHHSQWRAESSFRLLALSFLTAVSLRGPFNAKEANAFVPPLPVLFSERPTASAARFWMTRGREGLTTRSEAIASGLAYPLAFVAAFRAGAALSVIDQPRLPQIKTCVGSRIVRLPSGTRVRLFYPCTKISEEGVGGSGSGSGSVTAPYCTDGIQTSDGMASLVGFRQLGLSFLLAHLAEASSGCIQDAPIGKEQSGGLPLLIYSHGYGGNMDMGTYFLRTVASRGIIVAALEHTDGTASSTVLRDGSTLGFSPSLMSNREQLNRRAGEMLEAVDYLPEELARMDTGASTRTVGNIFLGGHSYGAPSAILAASRWLTSTNKSKSIAGLILHDPALGMGYGMLPDDNDISIPAVTYVSDEYNRANVRYGDLTLHVKGAFHGNFVDAPLWAPLWVMRPLSLLIPAAGPSDPMEIHDELADSAAAFVSTVNPESPSVMIGKLFEYVP